MLDHERSRDDYFRARKILKGIRWDQYEKDWQAPVRYLFECLLDAPADFEREDLEATYYSDVAFDHARKSGLFDAACRLRQCLPLKSDRPFADVYQAATWVLLREWPGRQIAEPVFFRGQRRPWLLFPTLYRYPNEIEAAIGRLTSYVRALQQARLSTTEAEGIAIAQHYSEENGVHTPLIDATRDPLVGLFFASLGGQRGDRGVLYALRDDDWRCYSCDGSNLMGALREITVRGVHRIEAQKRPVSLEPTPGAFPLFMFDSRVRASRWSDIRGPIRQSH